MINRIFLDNRIRILINKISPVHPCLPAYGGLILSENTQQNFYDFGLQHERKTDCQDEA